MKYFWHFIAVINTALFAFLVFWICSNNLFIDVDISGSTIETSTYVH